MMNNRLVIVSMTSWSKRINNVSTVIKSILNQEVKADYIELNLSTKEFKNKELDLPEELVNLIELNKSIELNWLDRNDGVFKKIIPTIKKFIGKKYYLLSIDDDYIYRADYIKMMIDYLELYESDTFCLANANVVIGNRQIYLSECFDLDFCDKLTQEMIDSKIDDTYTEEYLRKKGKKFSSFRPSDTKEITKVYNPIFPNSNNTKTGQYSSFDIANARKIARKIWGN